MFAGAAGAAGWRAVKAREGAAVVVVGVVLRPGREGLSRPIYSIRGKESVSHMALVMSVSPGKNIERLWQTHTHLARQTNTHEHRWLPGECVLFTSVSSVSMGVYLTKKFF